MLDALREQIEAAARRSMTTKEAQIEPQTNAGMHWFDAGAEWHNDPIVKRAAVGESIPSDGSWDPLRPDASPAGRRDPWLPGHHLGVEIMFNGHLHWSSE